MTNTVKVQHIFRGKSQLPRDVYVNSFYFGRTGPSGPGTPLTTTEANALVDAVQSFFHGLTAPQTVSVWARIAQMTLAVPHTQVKVYDMAPMPEGPNGNPLPRVPFLDIYPASQPVATAGSALPAEVAVCLSYNADPTATASAGVPKGRTRGRVYIGPLNTSTLYEETDLRSVPAPTFTRDLRLSGKRMQDAAQAASWLWVVHSPTTAALVDPENPAIQLSGDFPITNVSTDDAWDIQRRRGTTPTARTSLLTD